MRRKPAADVDSLRTVDVIASFQLDSLVVVSFTTSPWSKSTAAPISTLSEVTCWQIEAGPCIGEQCMSAHILHALLHHSLPMLDRHQHMLLRLLQGLAPFGADLAVLVYNTALEGASPRPPSSLAKTATMSGLSASDAIEASTELQHERPELKIFTWAHEEIAADALSITGGHAVPAH